MVARELPRDEDGRLSKWGWPGGYPLYYLDGDGSVLCADCARKSDEDVGEVPQFKPQAAGGNWEEGGLHCDQCGKAIEAAFRGHQDPGAGGKGARR